MIALIAAVLVISSMTVTVQILFFIRRLAVIAGETAGKKEQTRREYQHMLAQLKGTPTSRPLTIPSWMPAREFIADPYDGGCRCSMCRRLRDA